MRIERMKFVSFIVAIAMLFNFAAYSFGSSESNPYDVKKMKQVKNLNDVPGFNYLITDSEPSKTSIGDGQVIRPQIWAVEVIVAVVLAAAALVATIYQTVKTADFPTANNWVTSNVKQDGYIYKINGDGSKEMTAIKLSGVVYDHRTTANWVGYSYKSNNIVVSYVEGFLKRAGVFGYSPDNIYNSNTSVAVKALQKAHYIKEDGIVGRVTYEHMVCWR